MAAERDTIDRLVAHWLADRIGATFPGRISGVTRAGLFVKLDETGADGFVPMSTLGSDYFVYDEARHAVIGRRTGEMHRLGDRVEVKLVEAAPLAGALRFELLSEGRVVAKKDRPAEDRTRGARPAQGGGAGGVERGIRVPIVSRARLRNGVGRHHLQRGEDHRNRVVLDAQGERHGQVQRREVEGAGAIAGRAAGMADHLEAAGQCVFLEAESIADPAAVALRRGRSRPSSRRFSGP